ncbi:Uncharacterised protein [Bordetella pertussis]|nr:Uncharacterised protein [Bordetella pertussis]CFO75611.1 Uncharacterised protein [Bordetella pertussis]CPI21647.1 Uncharacterised protein [Bordetella pertussis]CPL07237.1 Uncharacterised protein [Bordetella pertussis]CPL54442.1 Uncharacterised protein [Bordetella pertussis]
MRTEKREPAWSMSRISRFIALMNRERAKMASMSAFSSLRAAC